MLKKPSTVCYLFLAAYLPIFLSCSGIDKPQSIILFIGDGMGWNQITADYYVDKESIYSRFSVVGAVHVEPSGKRLTAESASSATALATGKKVPRGVISEDESGAPLKTVLEKAGEAGKSVGIVVTCSITHATPAAFISHVDKRYREMEIARQISEKNIDVLLGGGKRFFLNNSLTEDNLLEKMIKRGYTFIGSKAELDQLDCEKTGRLIGLFADEGMEDARLRTITLGSMVEKALCLLERNPRGFFLLVEGSQIDWRGHENDYEGLLAEMRDFQGAVETALDFQERKRNILIVETADHETGGLVCKEKAHRYGEIDPVFVSKEHTVSIVPLFARGPGAEHFSGFKHISEIGIILNQLVK